MRIQQMNGLNNPKQRNSDRIKKKIHNTGPKYYKRHACYSKIQVC